MSQSVMMGDMEVAAPQGISRMSKEDKMLIEMRFANQKKSVAVAYLFLFFTVVGHNFYLGRIGRGVAQLLLCFILIGFIWSFIDIFTTAGTVKKMNQDLYNTLTIDALRN